MDTLLLGGVVAAPFVFSLPGVAASFSILAAGLDEGPPLLGPLGGPARVVASATAEARAASQLGPRSVGAAENTRAFISGNLNKLKDSRLKSLRINAEAVKKDIVGDAGGKFNLSVDSAGSVFLTPVRPGASPPIPTFSTLDELAAEFPPKR